MHEDPNVPNYGKKGRGVKLQAGMVIAIEPMITLGSNRVHTGSDGWLVSTDDGLPRRTTRTRSPSPTTAL